MPILQRHLRSEPQNHARCGAGEQSADLKQLAMYQRGLILCLLVQILAGAANGVARANLIPILASVTALVVLIAIIAGVVFAILVATRVYSTVLGIFLGLLAIIPCVGLVILLVINQAATKKLTENGIKVGFFGANMSQF